MKRVSTGFPLGIGSLPHEDAGRACATVLEHFPDSPFWPELPRRSWRESMGVEQARGLPGAVLDEVGEKAYFDLDRDLTGEMGDFYDSYLAGDFEAFAVSPEFLAGVEALNKALSAGNLKPLILKGQLTGPTTLGLVLRDSRGKALLYDEQMMDVLTKATRLKAQWMVSVMRPLCETPVIFFDEPMLQSVGSASIPIEKETAVARMREIVTDLGCLTGGHCCGNTDWSLMMAGGLDIIAYDAWSFGDTLGLYKDSLAAFIRSGGYIAWGIVPAGKKGVEVPVETLVEKVEQLSESTAANCGLATHELRETGFITPSCGLGSLTTDDAEAILKKTAAVSQALWPRRP